MKHPTRARKSRHLERLLDEPGRPLQSISRMAHHALTELLHLWPLWVSLGAVVVIGVAAVSRIRRKRLAHGGRLVTIGVPPEVEPAGALLLWSALHDLLRPHLARILSGQPHLAW